MQRTPRKVTRAQAANGSGAKRSARGIQIGEAAVARGKQRGDALDALRSLLVGAPQAFEAVRAYAAETGMSDEPAPAGATIGEVLAYLDETIAQRAGERLLAALARLS